MSYPPENSTLLFSEEEIEQALDRLAIQMNIDLADDPTVFVSVLRGALPFTWDLLRRMTIDIELEFIKVSRYFGMLGGEPRIVGWDPVSFEDKTVVIVDDVLDGGETIRLLTERFTPRSKKLRTAVLVRKLVGDRQKGHADYVALHAPDKFLIGRGMDIDGKYRELPAIYMLD